MTSTHLTIEKISWALYQIDPMQTCCKENECLDEYNRVAVGALGRLAQGTPLRTAMNDEFVQWFDVQLSTETLEEIEQTLSAASLAS